MANQERDEGFDELLAYLKKSRGFDFTAYKRSTLVRRVRRRMEVRKAQTYADYQKLLVTDGEEFQHLFNTILINVTSFFRDPEAWEVFANKIIPRVLEQRADEPIRAWVAGCASGEEAYTLAMVLSEAMGRENLARFVKIYATDLDEDALSHSRIAAYTSRDVKNVSESLLEEYFEKASDRYVFDRELRRCIIFGKHDLIADAPISRVELLLCRNTLMYFNVEAQERILSRFHFALSEGGYLFLGKAETLLTHGNAFVPVDLKRRIFTKAQHARIKDRSFMVSHRENSVARVLDPVGRLRDGVIDISPIAQIAIDEVGRLALANSAARSMFNLSPRDLGRPFHELEISYRPVELRSGIEQASQTRRPVLYTEVRWSSPSSDTAVLDIRITPVLGSNGESLGCSIAFDDVTEYKRLQGDLENFNQELETAYEEVQSTNEELQTTNEELQSTVEELETTNEELQSTNEELETMNEELQSSNEELETINDELRQRSDDLNEANAFLESVLGGLSEGVIVVDRDLAVLGWNARSADLWGLRFDEVRGKHLLNLDVGLPLDRLRPMVRACLMGEQSDELVLDAINRRGRPILVRALCSPLAGLGQTPRGAILMLGEIGADAHPSEPEPAAAGSEGGQ